MDLVLPIEEAVQEATDLLAPKNIGPYLEFG